MAEHEPKKLHIDMSAGDPEPSDEEERAEYVQRVAGFFTDIMDKKIEYLKSLQAIAMQDPEESDKMTQYRRGAINAFALLQDWGDQMIAEAQAIRYQRGSPDGTDGVLD